MSPLTMGIVAAGFRRGGGGGGGPTGPTGTYEWYASDLALADGAHVGTDAGSRWVSRYGSNYLDNTTGAGPTVQTVSGVKVVRFAKASSQWLNSSAPIISQAMISSGGGGVSVFTVLKANTLGATVISSSASHTFQLYIDTAGRMGFWKLTDLSGPGNGTVGIGTGWNVLEWRSVESQPHQTFVNNVMDLNSTMNMDWQGDNNRLGRREVPAGEYLDADLAALLIFSPRLSSDDATLVYNRLRTDFAALLP